MNCPQCGAVTLQQCVMFNGYWLTGSQAETVIKLLQDQSAEQAKKIKELESDLQNYKDWKNGK